MDEVLGESGLWVLLGAEVLEDVGELLPEVESFLFRYDVNQLVDWRRMNMRGTWYSW